MNRLFAIVLLVTAAGCGDDDEPGGRPDAMADARNDARDTGGDARDMGPPEDATPDATEDATPDATEDASDDAMADASDAGGDAGSSACNGDQQAYIAANDGALMTSLRDCFTSCMEMGVPAEEAEACIEACHIEANSDNAFGMGPETCEQCYYDRLICLLTGSCGGSCAGSPEGAPCIECQCDASCQLLFDACAGTALDGDQC